MAGVQGGMSEVVLICAVDFMTGATVLKTLVSPTRPVVDWRSRISGVTSVAMAAALTRGAALDGWRAARRQLWQYIDAETILVGHALQHDLESLRIIHPRVVDSAILARAAVSAGDNTGSGSAAGTEMGRQWGLKTLSEQLLGIAIQNHGGGGGGRGGGSQHDCLEDALAAREAVLWCLRNPHALRAWGIRRAAEEEVRERERDQRSKAHTGREERGAWKTKKKKKKIRPKQKTRGSKAKASVKEGDDETDDSEIMRWSDVAEDFGWPHPDTGYDPWSD
jgi:hypothetical protein